MLVVNLIAMPVLTVRFGLAGAASALVVTELFGTGFGWLLARKAFPLPFNPRHVSRICLATALMGLVLAALKLVLPSDVMSFCVIVTCGCATYLAAAFALDIVGVRKSLAALRQSGQLAVSKQAA